MSSLLPHWIAEQYSIVVNGQSNQGDIVVRTPRLRSPSPMVFPAAGLSTDVSAEPVLSLDFGESTSVDNWLQNDALAMVPVGVIPFSGASASDSVLDDIVAFSPTHYPDILAASASAPLIDLGSIGLNETLEWTFHIRLPWFELRELVGNQGL